MTGDCIISFIFSHQHHLSDDAFYKNGDSHLVHFDYCGGCLLLFKTLIIILIHFSLYLLDMCCAPNAKSTFDQFENISSYNQIPSLHEVVVSMRPNLFHSSHTADTIFNMTDIVILRLNYSMFRSS